MGHSGITVLLLQGKLFLNPSAIPGMPWSLALNSAVSFLTSTKMQVAVGASVLQMLVPLGLGCYWLFRLRK